MDRKRRFTTFVKDIDQACLDSQHRLAFYRNFNFAICKVSKCKNDHYFMLSGRISRNIGENIFRSYTGNTSENNDFHVLVA